MLKYRNKYPVSFILVLTTVLVYSVFFVTGKSMILNYTLNPSKLINYFETWRIITFVMVPGNYEGILLFVLTFLFIGHRLEERFNKSAFLLIIFLLICLQGTIFTLIYWQQDINYAGFEGVSLFTLTLFTLLEFPRKINFLKLKTYKLTAFSTILAITWFSSILIHHSFIADNNLIYSLSSATIGIISSILIYLQIRIVNRLRNRKEINRIIQSKEPEFIPYENEQTGSINQFRSSLRKQYNYYSDKDIYDDNDIKDDKDDSNLNTSFTEDELNRILDKINAQGQSSLKISEKQFLVEYSKKI